MTIILNNPNPFPTPPGFLEYSTTLEGTTLGQERLTPIPAIDAREEKRITIPLEVTPSQINGLLAEFLKKPTAVCVLSGAILYAVPGRGRRNFPFTDIAEVPLVP
jgi:hypothetical protein